MNFESSMLPSLAALSLGPVNRTRAAQLPVGTQLTNGTNPPKEWDKIGVFQKKPALSLGPVNRTRAAQLPVGTQLTNGIYAEDQWRPCARNKMFQDRPKKYPNDIARRLWGINWHAVHKPERLAFAKRVLKRLYEKKPNAREGDTLTNEDIELFVAAAKELMKDESKSGTTDSSSEEDTPLRDRLTGPNLARDLTSRMRRIEEASGLTLADLPLDVIENMVLTVVFMGYDPAERLQALCLTMKGLSKWCDVDSGMYASLISRLGWHPPLPPGKDKIELPVTGSPEWGNFFPKNYEKDTRSSKSWFLFCCGIYTEYVTLWWHAKEHGKDLATGRIFDHFGLSSDRVWIVKAVAESVHKFYNVYARVADLIEKQITEHFDGIKETLTGPQEEWYDDDELTFAVGCFYNSDAFEKLLRDDPTLDVLHKAMEMKEMPSGNFAENNMPIGFYTILYKSRQLVDSLRRAVQGPQSPELTKQIKEMFIEASALDTSFVEDAGVGGNDIAYDNYPSTIRFMKDLLKTWLFLPTLHDYVFDEGDCDAGYTGDSVQYWGYFRKRNVAKNERGISIPFEPDEVAEEDAEEDDEEDSDEE